METDDGREVYCRIIEEENLDLGLGPWVSRKLAPAACVCILYFSFPEEEKGISSKSNT